MNKFISICIIMYCIAGVFVPKNVLGLAVGLDKEQYQKMQEKAEKRKEAEEELDEVIKYLFLCNNKEDIDIDIDKKDGIGNIFIYRTDDYDMKSQLDKMKKYLPSVSDKFKLNFLEKFVQKIETIKTIKSELFKEKEDKRRDVDVKKRMMMMRIIGMISDILNSIEDDDILLTILNENVLIQFIKKEILFAQEEDFHYVIVDYKKREAHKYSKYVLCKSFVEMFLLRILKIKDDSKKIKLLDNMTFLNEDFLNQLLEEKDTDLNKKVFNIINKTFESIKKESLLLTSFLKYKEILKKYLRENYFNFICNIRKRTGVNDIPDKLLFVEVLENNSDNISENYEKYIEYINSIGNYYSDYIKNSIKTKIFQNRISNNENVVGIDIIKNLIKQRTSLLLNIKNQKFKMELFDVFKHDIYFYLIGQNDSLKETAGKLFCDIFKSCINKKQFLKDNIRIVNLLEDHEKNSLYNRIKMEEKFDLLHDFYNNCNNEFLQFIKDAKENIIEFFYDKEIKGNSGLINARRLLIIYFAVFSEYYEKHEEGHKRDNIDDKVFKFFKNEEFKKILTRLYKFFKAEYERKPYEPKYDRSYDFSRGSDLKEAMKVFSYSFDNKSLLLQKMGKVEEFMNCEEYQGGYVFSLTDKDKEERKQRYTKVINEIDKSLKKILASV